MNRIGQTALIGWPRSSGAVTARRGIVLLLAASLGCYSQPTVVPGVAIDIPIVCETLLAKHDADDNGMLSAEELASVPPLGSTIKRMDKGGDNSISQEELQSHFESVFNPKIGMLATMCRVTNNGKPLAGAVVHFVPADYLQVDRSVLPIASGITSAKGIAQMEIHPDYIPEDVPKLRGIVRPGFYLVEVTREGMSVPARYNSETTLGVEVSAATTISGTIDVPLKF